MLVSVSPKRITATNLAVNVEIDIRQAFVLLVCDRFRILCYLILTRAHVASSLSFVYKHRHVAFRSRTFIAKFTVHVPGRSCLFVLARSFLCQELRSSCISWFLTMKITFSCESCSSEFTVDGKLSGRSGRCKTCGARFVIPSEAGGPDERQGLKFASGSPNQSERRPSAVLAENRSASGHDQPIRLREPDNLIDRLTTTFKLKPVADEPPRLAQPKFAGNSPKSASPQRGTGWLDAVNNQIALKPVSLENLGSSHAAKQLEPDSISYQPSRSELDHLRKKKKSTKAGLIQQSYDGMFRKTAKLFRWINEAAYGISILFMILACVGYVMQLTTDSGSSTGGRGARNTRAADTSTSTEGTKALPLPNHRLITIGVSGIVILNLVRLVAGLANLIAIPFRKSPLEGILFLIPPMTFFYMAQNWKRMQKPVGRILGPIFALSLVIAAYTAIAMFGRGPNRRGDLLQNVNSALKSMKKDVGSSVEQLQNKVETLQNQLPSQLDGARKAVEGLQNQIQPVTEGQPVPSTNDANKKN